MVLLCPSSLVHAFYLLGAGSSQLSSVCINAICLWFSAGLCSSFTISCEASALVALALMLRSAENTIASLPRLRCAGDSWQVVRHCSAFVESQSQGL